MNRDFAPAIAPRAMPAPGKKHRTERMLSLGTPLCQALQLAVDDKGALTLPRVDMAGNKKPRRSLEPGVSVYGLAVTYFRVRNAHYHRRKPVSRFCSGWEGVGPGCCGRQIEEE